MLAAASYWVTWFPGAVLATLGILALVYKGINAFNRIIKMVDKVDYEFSPNGGKSMRDQVDAVRTEQTKVAMTLTSTDGLMTTHIESDRRAFARQDRFNTKIEGSLERIEDHIARA